MELLKDKTLFWEADLSTLDAEKISNILLNAFLKEALRKT